MSDISLHISTIIISLLFYAKSSKSHISKLRAIKILAAILFLSSIICVIKTTILISSVPLYITSILLLSLFIPNKTLSQTASTAIISVCIGYSFIAIFSILILGLISTLTNIQSPKFLLPYIDLTSLVLSFTVISFIFKIPRISSGFNFTSNRHLRTTGNIISTLYILINSILYYFQNDKLHTSTILLTIIFIATPVLIFIWIRKSIHTHYKNEVTERAFAQFQDKLAAKTAEHESLIKEYEKLAEVIHRDNKIVASLKLTLEAFIADQQTPSDEACRLMSLINAELTQRDSIMLTDYKSRKTLPQTDNAAVDSILSYMLTRATAEGINMELTISDSLNFEKHITDNELTTLLADLIENAIKATKHSEQKQILIAFSEHEKAPQISVKDSGTPFTVEVLAGLGLRKVTTDGTGIGMTTAFKILGQVGGSLILEEYAQESLYTKNITIKLDGRNNFIVQSPRADELAKTLSRADIHFQTPFNA